MRHRRHSRLSRRSTIAAACNGPARSASKNRRRSGACSRTACFITPTVKHASSLKTPARSRIARPRLSPLAVDRPRHGRPQWHTQTRTKKSAVLRKRAPEEIYVEINPGDARSRRIRPNQWVVVETRRGKVKAKAVLTHSVKPGQIFIPMHYESTNMLTLASYDPYSRQPSYKACAARVQSHRARKRRFRKSSLGRRPFVNHWIFNRLHVRVCLRSRR